MIAISTDDGKGLLLSIEDFAGEMPIRLASDESNEVFKKLRAYDDFEDQPLHGAFLIDGEGKVRWQGIGYEPFMEHEFLLKGAQRLLGSPQVDRSAVRRKDKALPGKGKKGKGKGKKKEKKEAEGVA